MVDFLSYLTEGAAEVVMSREAFKKLSPAAQSAVSNWEFINWADGTLSHEYENAGPIRLEIEAAMKPIRDMISKRTGKTIRLYRGLMHSSGVYRNIPKSDRLLYSWTARAKYAAAFANKAEALSKAGHVRLFKDYNTRFKTLTDRQIENAGVLLRSKGIVKVEDVYFKTFKDDPQWYSGFLPGAKEYVYGNDTKGFEKYLKSERDEKLQADVNRDNTGTVVWENIPVDDVVWILNTHGSMEYIVKGHSGSDGTKLDI